MNSVLVQAVTDSKKWLDRFHRNTYKNAFLEYENLYRAPYVEEIRTADDLASLADSLLDGMEAFWKKIRPWQRSVAKLEDKMVIVCYLNPMLSRTEDEKCAEFVSVLCSKWNGRYPKDAFETASYDQIRKGFNKTIFGFDVSALFGRKSDDDALN